MKPVVLNFADHHSRLGNIAWLARFLDAAIGRTAKTLPTEPRMLTVQEGLIDAVPGELIEKGRDNLG